MAEHATAIPNASRTRLRHGVAAGLLTAALAGCGTLAPRPAEVAPPIPADWIGLAEADAAATPAAVVGWEAYFRDPLLQRLIRITLDNNRDLRIAALRAEEARAAFRIQRSEQFPALGVNAQGARARVPGGLNASGVSVVGGEYRAEVGLSSWELDLWGRVHHLKTSALEQWLASEAGRHAVELALVAQVADGYLGLRELDERVALARRTVDTRAESFRIFSRRFEVGAASKLELTQVQTLLTQAQALLAQLELARAQQAHALGQLVGAHPGPLPEAAPFDEALVLSELSPALPSDLLIARPDIIAAEHRLRAANANIGAARAAFFPRISLTAQFGTVSDELSGLFKSGSWAFSLAPQLALPIFDAGRNQAGLESARAGREIAVAQYEKSIQTAFREVADALAGQATLQEQVDAQRAQAQADAKRFELSDLRYRNGVASYLDLLDAQRSLFATQQSLVVTRLQQLQNQVTLYKVLGGGWTAPAEETPRS